MAEFVTFQKFGDKESAEQFIKLLEKNALESILEDNSSSLDASFGGGGFTNEYAVKILQTDFEKANRVLIEDSIADLSKIDSDYYLFTFTDQELRDIVAHPDEWNAFDFMLARKLLKERGQEVNETELAALKQQRIAELSRPEPRQTSAIIAGYIMAFLGGLLGIIIGGYLFSHKKTLPNGQRISVYSEADRADGKRIFYIGIFFAVLWIFAYSFAPALVFAK